MRIGRFSPEMTPRADTAFELLHPQVQWAVQKLGWTALHPIQEQAIPLIIERTNDLIISAPTNGGKTEAVFLPVLSNLLSAPAPSFQVVCISPLKALINDQYRRLIALTRGMEIPVHRWHGDVDHQRKQASRNRPRGILLITPESLESNFLNFSHLVPCLYRHLHYAIIDEVHAFLGNERGIHLLSLLARLVEVIGHRPRCFGLSATLGDPQSARAFLNPEQPNSVELIQDDSTKRHIRVTIKTCVRSAKPSESPDNPHDNRDHVTASSVEEVSQKERPSNEGDSMALPDALGQIAMDIQDQFRGSTNLIFANSRRTVELMADYLRNHSKVLEDPESAFVLHHGSLSRQVRHHTETALKSGHPTNALCTSSLELGIDIGAIEAVAQIDPPCTVSSLVQRVGRSGRRNGQSSVLRMYVLSAVPKQDSAIDDLLFPKLLQAVAMTELLLLGWLEPIEWDRMHLSTLTHQILSKLKENGGVTVSELYRSLCQQGPFRRISPGEFKQLLSSLFEHRLIDQEPQGAIILGLAGEKITSAPNFYAAFATRLELSVRCGRTQVGKLPVTFEIKTGQCLLLNGKRWLIKELDWKTRTIWVAPTAIKKPTVFLGQGGDVHTRIFAQMRRILRGTDEPAWLDPDGKQQLAAARHAAEQVGLTQTDVLGGDDQVQWFPWLGTRGVTTLWLWAEKQQIPCSRGALSLTYEDVSTAGFRRHLEELVEDDVNAIELAALLRAKHHGKFDPFIDEGLLDKANAADRLDLGAAKQAAYNALAGLGP
jgi:ATP-dependent helicase Lhr and Lhr-like helicase